MARAETIVGNLGRHAAAQHPRQALDERHCCTERSRTCRQLQADETTAENGDMAAFHQMRANGGGIVMATQRGDASAMRRAR